MKMVDIKNCREVELSDAAYYNMILSAGEVYPLESGGEIFGKVHRNKIIIVNAYPLQTMKRMPSTLEYGDLSVVTRLRSLEEAISMNGAKARRAGGYHSHPRRDISPSSLDTKFAHQELTLNGNYWLEITLAIECEKNKTHKAGEDTRTRRWNFESTLWYSIQYGYRFSIGAFLYNKEGTFRQIMVKRQDAGNKI